MKKSLLFLAAILCIWSKSSHSNADVVLGKYKFVTHRFTLDGWKRYPAYRFITLLSHTGPIRLHDKGELKIGRSGDVFAVPKKRWKSLQKFVRQLVPQFGYSHKRRLRIEALFKQWGVPRGNYRLINRYAVPPHARYDRIHTELKILGIQGATLLLRVRHTYFDQKNKVIKVKQEPDRVPKRQAAPGKRSRLMLLPEEQKRAAAWRPFVPFSAFCSGIAILFLFGWRWRAEESGEPHKSDGPGRS